jgi:hypothetical protein
MRARFCEHTADLIERLAPQLGEHADRQITKPLPANGQPYPALQESRYVDDTSSRHALDCLYRTSATFVC